MFLSKYRRRLSELQERGPEARVNPRVLSPQPSSPAALQNGIRRNGAECLSVFSSQLLIEAAYLRLLKKKPERAGAVTCLVPQRGQKASSTVKTLEHLLQTRPGP